MIQMIEINKISHHPHNPRKDLGDLTELADSIKQSGILQNLTVVPWFSVYTGVGPDDPKQQEELGYYALIGNRRLAAAKLAGLTEVPCAIANLDKKEQVATMLLENMQRADLTAYEQAQGFQMMMDFGESVNDISDKTGFSESTVRRRMKLLELDQDKLKESESRGATLNDYIELEKIEDIETRNEVLEQVGTPNFNWALKNAIDREKESKERVKIIEIIEGFAERIETTTKDHRYFKNIWGIKDIEIPEDAETVDYCYTVSQYSICLYKVCPETETEADEKARERIEEEKRVERRSALEQISLRAYELRSEFIKNVSNTMAKKNIKYITGNIMHGILGGYFNYDTQDLADVLGIEIEDEDNDISEYVYKEPERFLLAMAYISLDKKRESYYDYYGKHKENNDLDRVYEMLKYLGYQMSEEEAALQNGTHELFNIE